MKWGDNIRPVKINKTILWIQKLIVKFHTRFMDSDTVYHSDFRFNETDYAITNYPSYLTLELVQDKSNSQYDPTNTVVISQRNIFALVKGLDKIIKNIYEKDIFATENGKIVTFADEVKESSVTVNLPFSKNAIMLVPSVVYDENGISYEGANIYLNNTANGTGLSIDALEALRYTISKVDFVTYSQAMVNYYIQYYKCSFDSPVDTKRRDFNTRPQINMDEPPKTEATFSRNKTEEEFKNLFK